MIHVGDNLLEFDAGRDAIGRVIAHEIAHNLGLEHVSATGNLMNGSYLGENLNNSQISQILASDLTR